MASEYPWEKLLGEDTVIRTANIGKNAISYRKKQKLEDPNVKDKRKHIEFIHRFGQDSLEIQHRVISQEPEEFYAAKVEDEKREQDLEQMIEQRLQKDLKIDAVHLQRDIFDDWKTSSWDNYMIEAACEYLVLLFSTKSDVTTNKLLSFALVMIDRLIFRHADAYQYIRKNIGNIIQRASNNLVLRGRCTSSLNLLYLLQVLLYKYSKDMTENLFCTRFCQQLMLEYNLAASIIQHFYHRRNFQRYQTIYQRSASKGITEQYFTSTQSETMFFDQYKVKLHEYRRLWTQMHQDTTTPLYPSWKYPSQFENPDHCRVGLAAMVGLVSDRDVDLAHINRLDILKTHALLLLPRFMVSCIDDKLVDLSSTLVFHISQAPESLGAMLNLGAFDSCLQRIKSERVHHHEGRQSAGFLQSLDTIYNLAIHVAGFHRASRKYDYITKKSLEAPEINYLKLLKDFQKTVDDALALRTLGSESLISELVQNLLLTRTVSSIKSILLCLYAIACGPCYGLVVEQIGRLSGKFIFRVVELLEEVDAGIAHIALAFLLQLCKQQAGRSCLISSSVVVALASLLKSPPAYDDTAYVYAVLLLSALCRCSEQYPSNPRQYHLSLVGIEVASRLVSEDLLMTIMGCDYSDNIKRSARQMLKMARVAANIATVSTVAAGVGVRYIVDFLTNPTQVDYYRSLSPEQFCIRAVLINSLCALPTTAALTATDSCIRYLCHCAYYSSYLFQGKPMAEEKAHLILISVLNAFEALKVFCAAQYTSKAHLILLNEVVAEMNVLEAASFFMRTLSTFHIGLKEDAKSLQEQVAVNAIKFLDAYLFLIQSSIDLMHQLDFMSIATNAAMIVLKNLKTVHRNRAFVYAVFEDLCWLLAKYCSSEMFALRAIQTDIIFEALHTYLPTSQSSIREYASEHAVYSHLPCSFFELLANLCATDLGVINSVSRGFLRATLGKLMMLYDLYDVDVAAWSERIRLGRGIPKPNTIRVQVAACLSGINRCANFNNASIGCAYEIILSDRYRVIAFCIEIIGLPECPRSDICFIEALRTLSRLSEDKARTTEFLCNSKLLHIITVDLNRCQGIPLECIEDYVKLLYNIASGIRILALRLQLMTLREPLYYVARIYPELLTPVRDTVWAITQNNRSVTAQTRNATNDDNDDLESYFTVKETFDLKELGIDLSDMEEFAGDPNATNGSPQHTENLNVEKPALELNTKLTESLPVLPLSKPSSRQREVRTQSFVSNNAHIRVNNIKRVPSQGTASRGSKAERPSRKFKDKIVSIDLESLPELKLTRPALPMKQP